MYKPTNRPWSEQDREELMQLWALIPSIALIAIKLNRSIASVQSFASRLGLPRRNNKIGQSYTRWTVSQDEKLQQSVAMHTDTENKIDIVKVADELNRSIDTVIGKLIEIKGNEVEVLSTCFAQLDLLVAKKQSAKFYDDRKSAKPRRCMTCRRLFWSEGAHNRICPECKEINQEIDETEHSIQF